MTEARLGGRAVREFAGCDLQPLDFQPFMEFVLDQRLRRQAPLVVGHHNLHSLYWYHRDTDVARFYAGCQACYLDGMGALWLFRAAGLTGSKIKRFSLMDRFPALLTLAEQRGLRVFYLGGSEHGVRLAADWISEAWPRLRFRLHHGYLETAGEVVDSINAFRPDLLLVGMGMPRQERWIMDHAGGLRAGIVMQAGGTLDYYTGLQARPPERWSRIGLGWLHRLLHDPRRLWRRYLVTPFALLRPALRLRRSLSKQAKG
jgi:N-acetylglucosaminyldiphosphoundecaprenol N-acetyl-beta-D-mannosaminyltransferase